MTAVAMTSAAPLQNAATKPARTASAGMLLQRKCACGASTGSVADKCDDCQSKTLQRKLAVGSSNDPLELEADRVADQVMSAPAWGRVGAAPLSIQRFSGHTGGGVGAAPASVDRVLASGGRPLDPALRHDMEQRFGHDFSRVRVHSGSAAEQSARDVSARAYTAGSDVVFRGGAFTPGTHEGRRLIAHELTHVVQQSGAASGIHTPAQPANRWVQRLDMLDVRANIEASKLDDYVTKHSLPYTHVINAIKDAGTFEDNLAAAFVGRQLCATLERFAGTPEGRGMLDVLYDAIITGDVTEFERRQAKRIIDAKTVGTSPATFLSGAEKAKIFPARNQGFTRDTYATFKAKLSRGKVRVYYDDTHFDRPRFKADIDALGGYSAARRGFEFDVDEVVGVKLYDQDGAVKYMRAIELIDYANQLSEHGLGLGKTAFFTGLTVGYGGLAPAVGPRALVWADRAVAVYSVASTVIKEHRDWILEKMPNFGPDLLGAIGRIDSVVEKYGLSRLGLDGLRLARSKLGSAWQGWRGEARRSQVSNSSKFKKVDSEVEDVLNDLAQREGNEAVRMINRQPNARPSGKPGNRRIPAGDGHEIVEVPRVGGAGTACEYHSPLPHRKVLCPEQMQSSDSTPGHADAGHQAAAAPLPGVAPTPAEKQFFESEAAKAAASAQKMTRGAAADRGLATQLKRAGKPEEAAAAISRAEAAEKAASNYRADAQVARDILESDARAAQAAKSLDTQRKLKERIARLEKEARNSLTKPGGRNPGEIRHELRSAKARLAVAIEIAAGQTIERKEYLRKRTPFRGPGGNERARAFERLQKKVPGTADEFEDYVTGKSYPRSELHLDHIVSVDEVFKMNGFGQLPKRAQLEIMDMPENIKLLEATLNESKGRSSLGNWLSAKASGAPKNLTDARKQSLKAIEEQARAHVKAEIEKRLSDLGLK